LEKIKELRLTLPPIEEQTAIANYLDHKTAQIDTLIAKKEKFISLLQEERTAVINQAVTKGLDPKVKMKDSGIEWLGEIPEHWEVKKLKYLLKENKDSLKTGPFGSHIKNSDYIPNGNYKVYTQRNVLDNEYENGCESISEEKFDELKGFTIYEGDVLITTRGSIGRCSVFPENMPTGILHPCLIRIQINENLSLRNWIVNYINNTSLFYNNVKFNSNSTIIDVIYGYTLKEIFFPTPSIIEQKQILDFLEVKINEIDTLISKSQQEIELLKEYKTALISEVVTGKVDVRDEVLN
jgi:type I restriction enzyme S subunit